MRDGKNRPIWRCGPCKKKRSVLNGPAVVGGQANGTFFARVDRADVNHSCFFVDPAMGANTQPIEAANWGHVKTHICKRMMGTRLQTTSYPVTLLPGGGLGNISTLLSWICLLKFPISIRRPQQLVLRFIFVFVLGHIIEIGQCFTFGGINLFSVTV